MTEPRTSRRVARVVLLVLMLSLVAVALPTVPAVWEWAVYSGARIYSGRRVALERLPEELRGR